MEKSTVKSSLSIFKISLFIAGILVFAGFSHRPLPLFLLSFTGLIVSVLVIASEIRTLKDLFVLFDLHNLSKKRIWYLPVCIIIGLVFGIIYRDYLQVGILPVSFTGFAVIAMAIGSSEELLFRGYLQSRIRNHHAVLSVLAATCAHTAYKLLLFLPYRSEPDISIIFILRWTGICPAERILAEQRLPGYKSCPV
jgi:membrane protease YdiL (CAAX protease family)